jgi:hypothetical protein
MFVWWLSDSSSCDVCFHALKGASAFDDADGRFLYGGLLRTQAGALVCVCMYYTQVNECVSESVCVSFEYMRPIDNS